MTRGRRRKRGRGGERAGGGGAQQGARQVEGASDDPCLREGLHVVERRGAPLRHDLDAADDSDREGGSDLCEPCDVHLMG